MPLGRLVAFLAPLALLVLVWAGAVALFRVVMGTWR
jgi:hypothetical protein